MTNILVSSNNPHVKTILIKYLENAGFEVINQENDLISVNLTCQELSTTTDCKKSNIQQSIFPSIPRLSDVFEFIELNYHHNIKLKEVAQAVGYSSAYLTDLVRRLTGKTVNNWIIERRIIQAAILLLETNYSIDDIALKVGYRNVNHFYCQFRDYYHQTPAAWRESQHDQGHYSAHRSQKQCPELVEWS